LETQKTDVFSHTGKIDTKINIYKKYMIMHKLNCRTYLFQWNYSIILGEREKGKLNGKTFMILHTIRCEGR
jgi:hypothetical protein